MKKNYFLTLLFSLIVSAFSYSQEALITAYVDATCSGATPRTVEIYVNGTIDFTGWSLVKQTNGAGFAPGSANLATIDISSLGSITDAFVYITNSTANLNTEFGITANTLQSGSINSNGDDAFQLVNSSDQVIDRFGEDGVDGTNMAWEHVDTYVYRNDGSSPNAGAFDVSNWTIGAENLLDNTCGSTMNSLVPLGTYMATASSNPSLTITSPANNAVLTNVTTATVSVSTSNFTVGNVGGSGVDGHIHWTVQENSNTAVAQPMKYDLNDEVINVTAGNTYTVFMQLVDNTHTPISPAVNTTTTFTVEHPCDLQLGTITKSCDATTSGADTYTTSITFTGGGTSTYTLNADNGAISGDDPSTATDGTITISGVTEGTDIVFTAMGDASSSSCDLTRNISSPFCNPLPFYDGFDYANAALITDQENWTVLGTSGDDMLVTNGNLDYTGLVASNGNSLIFDGSGKDAFTTFNATSGIVYASFLLKVTAFQTGSSPDVTDGGYIAGLAGSTSGYDARTWVRPNPDTNGTTYDIGFGFESTNPPFTSSTYNLNDVVFVVMGYNLDTAEISLWVNPDASSFGGTTIPTATLSSTDTNPPSLISHFVLRQDSSNETPFIQVDEVRVSNSWADVTPTATASLEKKNISGFNAYPNPTENVLTVSSFSSDEKQVTIYNVLGKKVFTTKFTGTHKPLDISSIKSGIYILKVTENNKTATKKLVFK